MTMSSIEAEYIASKKLFFQRSYSPRGAELSSSYYYYLVITQVLEQRQNITFVLSNTKELNKVPSTK